MTDDANAKKTIAQRLTALEHALFGDQVAILKYKKAVEGYVTPRGPQPPPGVITRMQGQLETATDALAAIQLRLNKLQIEVDELDVDEGTFAKKSFVDEGLARLSNALRDEFGREKLGKMFEHELTRLDGRIDNIHGGLIELTQFLSEAVPKKIKKRLGKLMDRWRPNESGVWILRIMANYLGAPEPTP